MKQEIERKFLVKDDSWRAVSGPGVMCRQGYLSTDGQATVRIRIIGDHAFLTIKGPSKGIARAEMEYPVPVADAVYMLDHLCGTRIVSKTRYTFPVNGVVWEVDEFHAAHDGLILAEVELEREDQPVQLPAWIGADVSREKQYKNVFLANHPYKNRP